MSDAPGGGGDPAGPGPGDPGDVDHLDADYRRAGLGGRLAPGDRPVLLLVDLMHAYFDDDLPLCLPDRACLDAAAGLLARARASGTPVVHTRVEFSTGGTDGGLFLDKVPALNTLVGSSRANRLMPEVEPHGDEVVVTKQYASAFFGTSLASMLTARRIDTVVLAGVSTSGCIRASAVDAMQHGFVPVVVADAVGDRDPGPHEANLFDLQSKYAEVVDLASGMDLLTP